MKKIVWMALACLLMFGAAATVSAQFTPTDFLAVNMDGRLPTIDGDMSDWAWVPEYYHFTMTDNFRFDRGDESHGLDDFDFDVMLGWSSEEDAVYMMWHVHDDQHQVDLSDEGVTQVNIDDRFENHLQHAFPITEYSSGMGEGETGTDHVAFQYKDGIQYRPALYPYNFTRIPPQIDGWTCWWTNPPYGEIATRSEGNEHYLELKMTVFDFWAWAGPDQSTRSELLPDEEITWFVVILDNDDWDPETGRLQSVWMTHEDSPMSTWGLYLMPPEVVSVEPSSWGAVKSLLR